VLAELADGWSFTPEGEGRARDVRLPHGWQADEQTRNFSGTASYAVSFDVPADRLVADGRIILDFGEALPIARQRQADGTLRGRSFAALLEPPIREAATLFVNDQPAGRLWAPPYSLDITSLLRPGRNRLRVEVYNTAVNRLAAGGLPDMPALLQRYGQRARLQDIDDLRPLPSGLLRAPRLLWRG
jgi:hypothetical protein